jgi:hypothetical protein
VGGNILTLGAGGFLKVKGVTSYAIQVQGGYVRVAGASQFLQGNFTLEALVSAEGLDWAANGYWYTVFSCSAQETTPKRGFALYAGPVDPLDPQSDYHWQVWVSTSAGGFKQLRPDQRYYLKVEPPPSGSGTYVLTYNGLDTNPIPATDDGNLVATELIALGAHVGVELRDRPSTSIRLFFRTPPTSLTVDDSNLAAAGGGCTLRKDPGLLVESNKTTYLALTYWAPTFYLNYYHPGRDTDFLSYELPLPANEVYVPDAPDADLLIGVDGPFLGSTPQVNYPFEGRIEEVAVYNRVLTPPVLFRHGAAAFWD